MNACSNVGWKRLYKPIYDYIEEYNKTHDDKIIVEEVKSKFGSMVVSIKKSNSELDELISSAEEESKHVCERCGSRIEEENTNGDFRYTLCEKCLNDKFLR